MLLLAVLALVALGWIEVRTPPDLSFSTFYFVPVVIASWWGGPRWGVFAAAFATTDFMLANYFNAAVYDHVALRAWTGVNDLSAHLFTVFVVVRLRRAILAEREKHQRLEEALTEVQTLEGLLPVCAWCRKVRDDRGYWSQLESFISRKTRTRFSHGICPACAEKVRQENPELFTRAQGSDETGRDVGI